MMSDVHRIYAGRDKHTQATFIFGKDMSYKNNHYVPQLILRRFDERLTTFNVKTGEIKEDQSTVSVFSEQEFYPVEIEQAFNQYAEAPFASILNKKLLKANCGDEVTLTRKEVNTIRKFLLLEQMRINLPDSLSPDDAFVQSPALMVFPYPFKEKSVEGETNHDRWLRNIRVILECKNLNHIQEHPLCTYEAYRWARIYSSGYMAIWDSSYDGTEFLISDIGMTSELEDSIFEYGMEVDKKAYLVSQLERYTDTSMGYGKVYRDLLDSQFYFHENFYMFSISKYRMLVIINPFFRLYTKREKFPEPGIWPTKVKDRRLFEKNRSPKISIIMGKPKYSDSDEFNYKIQSMKHEDILWVNTLMLDRIDTLLGFTSFAGVSESINAYMNWYKEQGINPRIDYSKLQEAIMTRK